MKKRCLYSAVFSELKTLTGATRYEKTKPKACVHEGNQAIYVKMMAKLYLRNPRVQYEVIRTNLVEV